MSRVRDDGAHAPRVHGNRMNHVQPHGCDRHAHDVHALRDCVNAYVLNCDCTSKNSFDYSVYSVK